MKRLGNLRILTDERAFLRWKVKSDIKLQNQCIKRFAVNARINHAVAIWRLRWLVERSKLESQTKERGYQDNLEEFLSRMDRVKREVYSNRNQLQNAFINIRRQYNYVKKVEEFEIKCKKILKERDMTQTAFYSIRKASQLKKFLVEKLMFAQDQKLRRGYEGLIDNYRRYLADKTSLMSENIIQTSLNILEAKAAKNVTKCFNTNPNYERGLDRLSKVMQNRQKLDKTYALNKVCTSMTGHQKKVQNALAKLEKIAKDVSSNNLRKLRENNKLKKAFIL